MKPNRQKKIITYWEAGLAGVLSVDLCWHWQLQEQLPVGWKTHLLPQFCSFHMESGQNAWATCAFSVNPPHQRLWDTTCTHTFSKHRPSGPMLSISRNVSLSVCLSVCLFTFEVPFKHLFAPTSRSWMSNMFKDSKSLGKSYGKKWSQIWTFLFESCLKLQRKKNFILLILPYKTWWKPRFPMD